jgi:hypothetical protein
MQHNLEIDVDEENKNLIDRCMSVEAGGDEVLFDKEYKFDDGVRLALRICSSRAFYNDPYQIWSEAILFNRFGEELAVSDVGDSVYGEYLFFVDGDEYHAIVK